MGFGGGGEVEIGFIGGGGGRRGEGGDGEGGGGGCGGGGCGERGVEADLSGEVGEGAAQGGFSARVVGEVEEGVDVGFGLLIREDKVEILDTELDGGAIGGIGVEVELLLIDKDRF